ncbi:calcium-binding protein [Acuticoccus sp. I52.16.1]|uniref:calcium-binding protein n=1 Tax=Acuticoccus sp. I52.16.1 TaxID=2928472 RepID=UPI001FD367CB|nr:calcium-binding protein [Acuticoccus sp. I52.16.1]UOM35662.1 hypothetical protein MRB58_05505 [Acuticoccus sp. I52.16.1]
MTLRQTDFVEITGARDIEAAVVGDRTFVYAAVKTGPNIGDAVTVAYELTSDGSLDAIETEADPVGQLDFEVVAVGEATYLFTVGETDDADNLSSYRIEDDGSLTPIATQTFEAQSVSNDIDVLTVGDRSFVGLGSANGYTAQRVEADGTFVETDRVGLAFARSFTASLHDEGAIFVEGAYDSGNEFNSFYAYYPLYEDGTFGELIATGIFIFDASSEVSTQVGDVTYFYGKARRDGFLGWSRTDAGTFNETFDTGVGHRTSPLATGTIDGTSYLVVTGVPDGLQVASIDPDGSLSPQGGIVEGDEIDGLLGVETTVLTTVDGDPYVLTVGQGDGATGLYAYAFAAVQAEPNTATPNDDDLTGTPGDDTINGLAGDDTIRSSGGDDRLLGRLGNDALIGGRGDDAAYGGAGADTLVGLAGDDTLDGQDDDDRLFGNEGDDVLFGGDGNDELVGHTGDDTLRGQNGADLLEGNRGNDFLVGGEGSDTLNGGSGIDFLVGGDAQDTFVVAAGNARTTIRDYERNADTVDLTAFDSVGGPLVFSQDGDDTIVTLGSAVVVLKNIGLNIVNINGFNGFDEIVDGVFIGRAVGDTLNGGEGDDRLLGNGGGDLLRGGIGRDELRGGEGDDELYGGAGDDTLLGGRGDDLLVGGRGEDTLDGGAGVNVLIGFDAGRSETNAADTFVIAPTSPRTTIGDYDAGIDTIDLTAFDADEDDLVFSQTGADTTLALGSTLVVLQNTAPSDVDLADFMV